MEIKYFFGKGGGGVGWSISHEFDVVSKISVPPLSKQEQNSKGFPFSKYQLRGFDCRGHL